MGRWHLWGRRRWSWTSARTLTDTIGLWGIRAPPPPWQLSLAPVHPLVRIGKCIDGDFYYLNFSWLFRSTRFAHSSFFILNFLLSLSSSDELVPHRGLFRLFYTQLCDGCQSISRSSWLCSLQDYYIAIFSFLIFEVSCISLWVSTMRLVSTWTDFFVKLTDTVISTIFVLWIFVTA